ncbi:MAG: LysR substrate-binding domain-containing protein [Methylophilaceae bacterium]|nr:LysR substrate-binding domain-containing protein [Methylophilaceae bacterium]
MTLNELRYVVALARERNFRRAAETCFVSQPALSLAIQKLEDELGVRLFERKKTEAMPTPVGERVVEQAARVLDEAAKIKEVARQGADQLVGPLRLGVIYTVGPYLLPELIPILHARAPAMPLDVEENTTANLVTQLRGGGVDVVIIALPFDVPGVETLPLYDEPFMVVVPKTHAWSRRRRVVAAELSSEKVLLLNSGHCFSNQVVEACPELSRKGEVLQGNSLETIRNMVATGLGITVLPCSAVTQRYGNPLVKVLPFEQPVPARRIALAYRRSFVRIQAVKVMAEAIRSIRSTCFNPVTYPD